MVTLSTGVVGTVAGKPGVVGSSDGVGTAAMLYYPTGLCYDADGLYVADTSNQIVRLASVPRAPVIQTQPQSQTVTAGSSVTFSVVAAGSPAPTYQWQYNGSAIIGATSSSLTIASAQSGQAGTYAVVVTNSLGSVTSSGAVLTVNTPSPPSSGGGGGGGGGAPSLWFYACLTALLAARMVWSRRTEIV
jgi:hypothetical protein